MSQDVIEVVPEIAPVLFGPHDGGHDAHTERSSLVCRMRWPSRWDEINRAYGRVRPAL